jgi:iron complex outermembrane recepter protein
LARAEGLAGYENGVRVNESFGDTVSLDLVPASAITSINHDLSVRIAKF